jgi:hypothetical protein
MIKGELATNKLFYFSDSYDEMPQELNENRELGKKPGLPSGFPAFDTINLRLQERTTIYISRAIRNW